LPFDDFFFQKEFSQFEYQVSLLFHLNKTSDLLFLSFYLGWRISGKGYSSGLWRDFPLFFEVSHPLGSLIIEPLIKDK